MKFDNRDYILGVLLLMPGFLFLATLDLVVRPNLNQPLGKIDSIIINPAFRFYMGIGCIVIAVLCIGLIISNILKNKKRNGS